MKKLLLLFLLCAARAMAQDSAISYLSTDHVAAGATGFNLTIVWQRLIGCGGAGNNFYFNGTQLTTLSSGSDFSVVTVPATLLKAIGTVPVQYICSSHTSNVLPFRVLTPLANVTSYSPTYFPTGQSTAVVVNGQDFQSNATIIFDWQPVTTTFVNSTQLTATIPGIFIGSNLPHNVAVYNSTFPGGSITKIVPTQFTFGAISVSAPLPNALNGLVIRDTSGFVTLGTPWYQITGTNANAFSVSTLQCADGFVMNPGQSCNFSIACTPPSSGSLTATMTIFSNASNGAQVNPLTCTGSSAKTIAAAPTSLSYGAVSTGASSAQTIALSALFGSFSLSTPFASLSGANASEFSKDTACDGQTLGGCTATITFSPATAGSKVATLTINSAADNTLTIPLSGTAVTATTHHVLLNWTASTSANVVGYNIYRSVASGPFGPINGGTPINATTYTDTTVVPGTTYIYSVTAVGGPPSWPTGTESPAVLSSPVTP